MTMLSGLCLQLQAQEKGKKVKILPVPAIGHSVETGTYVGAVALFTLDFYQDSLTRTSNAQAEFNYTWKNQVIAEVEWNHFFRDEQWFSRGRVHYSRFPDLYYGVGSDTPESAELDYTTDRVIFEGFAFKRLNSLFFAGPNLKYINFSRLRIEENGIAFPELTVASTFGLGYGLLSDTRDNLLNPRKGSYLFVNLTQNWSDANYTEMLIDGRYYRSWKDKLTLSLRFISDFNFQRPPFYDYAILGGDQFVRGYYFGRFRDQYMNSFQSEFKFPLVWRFGLAVFGGLSNLYPEFSAFSVEDFKVNYGAGLRFLIDTKDNINLRIDFARGEADNSAFYIAFGESF